MAGGPVGGNQGGDFIQPSISTTVRRMTPRNEDYNPDDYTQISWRAKKQKIAPMDIDTRRKFNGCSSNEMDWRKNTTSRK